MTKPQAASEPSMEDILASIRKMISEDRLDARPIPDQIARTSIGERITPRPVPKTGDWDRKEKSEPDEAKPAPVPSLATASEPVAAERPVPSFSSLSDALKSAAPGAIRPSLDDKLADMLDGDGKPGTNGRDSAPAAAPLAVFAGSRAQSASPAKPQIHNGASNGSSPMAQVRPASVLRAPVVQEQPTPTTVLAEQRSERAQPPIGARVQPTLKPVSEKPDSEISGFPPSAKNRSALNGFSGHTPASASTAAAVAPTAVKVAEPPAEPVKQNGSAGDALTADSEGRSRSSTQQVKSEIERSIVEPKAETQRIIAMPARFPTSSGHVSAGHGDTSGLINASPTNGSLTNGALNAALNGARASVFGLRPAGVQPPSARPLASKEVGVRAEESVKAEPHKPESNRAPIAATLIVETPQSLKTHRDDIVEAATSTGPELEAKRAPEHSREPAEALEALKMAVAAHGEEASAHPTVETGVASGPSERLVDAVMDLVHSQPEVLSVFTSGASFIHGVGGSHHHDEPADDPSLTLPALPVEQSNPLGARKLDRSAAELLRPMLRQWLADNMPRIVEDALRSELMSSQGDETPDKG
jgi:hypothetical protein